MMSQDLGATMARLTSTEQQQGSNNEFCRAQAYSEQGCVAACDKDSQCTTVPAMAPQQRPATTKQTYALVYMLYDGRYCLEAAKQHLCHTTARCNCEAQERLTSVSPSIYDSATAVTTNH